MSPSSDPTDGALDWQARAAALEAELAEARREAAFYRTMVEDAIEGVWQIDAETRTTFANARMAEMLGTTPEAMSGKPLPEFIFPEDAPVLEALVDRRRNGIREQHDFRFRRVDGTAVHARIATHPILDAEGRFQGAVAWAHDVTELLAAHDEARARALELSHERDLLQRIVRYVPALVAYHDRDFVYRWVNPTFERLLGVTHDQLVGRPVQAAFPEAEETFMPVMRQVAETLEPFLAAGFPFSYELDGQPKTTLWDLAFVPVIAPDGSLDGVLGFGVEVSDRHEYEQLQQVRIQDLERAAVQKIEFMGVVSHELRTPIQVLMGFCTVLEQELAGPLTDSQREYLQRMYNALKGLGKLVDEILDLCQAHYGGLAIHLRAINVDEVIDGAVTDMQALAGRKRQRVVWEAPAGLPPIVADDHRVYQVLANMLSNAIKFSPEGGTVRLGVEETPEGVRVTVSDDGPGISPADRERLFQPFSQLDMGLTREAGGVGMGLSIAKALVEAHGGAIGVESASGGGACFWFTLPREARTKS